MSNWRCPLCQGNNCEWLFESIDSGGIVTDNMAHVRYQQCGLFCLEPRPRRDQLAALYGPGCKSCWLPLDEDLVRGRRWMRRRYWKQRCRQVDRALPQGGRVLDVGCGSGQFLHQLCQDAHWQGLGIDISDAALAIARRQGVRCQLGELNEQRFLPGSFDVITIWQVLEHLPDPVGTMLEVRRLLATDGWLFLSTPNGCSLQARLWDRYWAGWEAPFHLQVFSPTSLQRLLQETGFELTRQIRLSVSGWLAIQSLQRYLEFARRRTPTSPPQRLITLLALAAWPFQRLVDLTTFSPDMIITARIAADPGDSS